MKYEHILQKFAENQTLEISPSGKCQMVVNDSLFITMEKSLDETGFFLYGVVTELAQGREEIALIALKGNVFFCETGGATLGLSNSTLILFQFFDETEIDYPKFKSEFDKFILYLTYWKNKVETDTSPTFEELSLDKHFFELKKHQDMKILFA